MKSIKVKTLDDIFSKCIRAQYDWICQWQHCRFCKNFSFENNTGGLDCSHLYTRETRATRWFPDNCMAMCNARHRWIGKRPVEHTAHFRKFLGDSRFDDLVLSGNGHRKYTPYDRWEMNQHYKAMRAEQKRKRKNGIQGYLPLVRWD